MQSKAAMTRRERAAFRAEIKGLKEDLRIARRIIRKLERQATHMQAQLQPQKQIAAANQDIGALRNELAGLLTANAFRDGKLLPRIVLAPRNAGAGDRVVFTLGSVGLSVEDISRVLRGIPPVTDTPAPDQS